MSKAINSKASVGAKARKNTGKATMREASVELDNAVITHPAPVRPQGVIQDNPALKDKLRLLACNVNCLIGVPILNWPETIIVYVMLLSLAALTALGAYKQIVKLGSNAGLLAAAVGAAAGR